MEHEDIKPSVNICTRIYEQVQTSTLEYMTKCEFQNRDLLTSVNINMGMDDQLRIAKE